MLIEAATLARSTTACSASAYYLSLALAPAFMLAFAGMLIAAAGRSPLRLTAALKCLALSLSYSLPLLSTFTAGPQTARPHLATLAGVRPAVLFHLPGYISRKFSW